MSILKGVKILEIEGLGPGPFCGMLLADMGADVITLVRPGSSNNVEGNITRRGKNVVGADLKSAEGRDLCLSLVAKADGLIEGMRPGVMERLGLGPDVCMSANPTLAYGRLTGWGQMGPLAQSAGHDINYIALSGALWYAGHKDEAPFAPPTLIGDIAGGSLYLALGLLGTIMQARATGKGDIIDAAIVDGSAHMMNLVLTARAAGLMQETRGSSVLDGSHWYDSYKCKDGKYITLGSLEPQFYALLLQLLKLDSDALFQDQYAVDKWPAQKTTLAAVIAKKTQSEWMDILEGSDACFAPVLAPSEAAEHPHIKAREIYSTETVLQAAPAPRFAHHPSAKPRDAQLISSDEALKLWS